MVKCIKIGNENCLRYEYPFIMKVPNSNYYYKLNT